MIKINYIISLLTFILFFVKKSNSFDILYQNSFMQFFLLIFIDTDVEEQFIEMNVYRTARLESIVWTKRSVWNKIQTTTEDLHSFLLCNLQLGVKISEKHIFLK